MIQSSGEQNSLSVVSCLICSLCQILVLKSNFYFILSSIERKDSAIHRHTWIPKFFSFNLLYKDPDSRFSGGSFLWISYFSFLNPSHYFAAVPIFNP